MIVVTAIYTTLGLAGTLAEALRDHGILNIGVFVMGCLLVLATVVTQGLSVRPSGVEIAVGLGISAAYILLFVRMAIPTERSHLIEYGVVAVFIYEALTERVSHGDCVPVPGIVAFVAASLLGVIDECIQFVLPSRVFEWTDILFNVLAAAMAIGASAALQHARRWAARSN